MGWKVKPTCPFKHKYELVEWMFKKYPNVITSRITKMTKKQLYAIWYKAQVGSPNPKQHIYLINVIINI